MVGLRRRMQFLDAGHLLNAVRILLLLLFHRNRVFAVFHLLPGGFRPRFVSGPMTEIRHETREVQAGYANPALSYSTRMSFFKATTSATENDDN